MASGTKEGNAEALRNQDRELAAFIFRSMKAISPLAMVQGNPLKSPETVIDGQFDLVLLAELIREELREKLNRK